MSRLYRSSWGFFDLIIEDLGARKKFLLIVSYNDSRKEKIKARSAGFILPDVQWKLRAHEVCITHSNASSLFSFFFPVDNNGHCSKIGEEVIEIAL